MSGWTTISREGGRHVGAIDEPEERSDRQARCETSLERPDLVVWDRLHTRTHMHTHKPAQQEKEAKVVRYMHAMLVRSPLRARGSKVTGRDVRAQPGELQERDRTTGPSRDLFTKWAEKSDPVQ